MKKTENNQLVVGILVLFRNASSSHFIPCRGARAWHCW